MKIIYLTVSSIWFSCIHCVQNIWLSWILSIIWILQNLLGHLLEKALGNSFQKSLGDLDNELILHQVLVNPEETCH